MTPALVAVAFLVYSPTPVSNGDNANQIRASIYEVATGNQAGRIVAPGAAPAQRVVVPARARRARAAR